MSTIEGPRPAAEVTHPGGMEARRLFPTPERAALDPFVVFERFHIEPDQGFPTHPHRGFEIVSYVLDGGLAHEDSLGASSVARAGDAMRITTGPGYEHSELPADNEYCSGLQLWVNLPRDEKGTEPSYAEARAVELPTTAAPGAAVTTVVGEGSPLELRTPVRYLDVTIDDAWSWRVPDGWAGFVYAVSGSGTADGAAFGPADSLVAEGGGGAELATAGDPLRVVAVAGRPHREPIRQRGPFVE